VVGAGSGQWGERGREEENGTAEVIDGAHAELVGD
jgi:hypothetical protein